MLSHNCITHVILACIILSKHMGLHFLVDNIIVKVHGAHGKTILNKLLSTFRVASYFSGVLVFSSTILVAHNFRNPDFAYNPVCK